MHGLAGNGRLLLAWGLAVGSFTLPWRPLSAWVVSCFGDSHTEGIYGAPWVPDLQRRLRVECRNFGRNAWTAASVARRADAAQGAEAAVVLAGTNDAMLELAWRAGNQGMLSIYRALNQLPADYEPSQEAFAASFRHLLQAVKASRVAVLSLPPLGEAASGEAAEVIASYNRQIRDVVQTDPRAEYVPFAEHLDGVSGEGFDASSTAFSQTIAQMYFHTGLRWLPGGPSFDFLAQRCGREVVHDKIHLTEKSAGTLLELVSRALTREELSPRS